jgi:hypothetical protein
MVDVQVKWIGDLELLFVAQGHKKPVGHLEDKKQSVRNDGLVRCDKKIDLRNGYTAS